MQRGGMVIHLHCFLNAVYRNESFHSYEADNKILQSIYFPYYVCIFSSLCFDVCEGFH